MKFYATEEFAKIQGRTIYRDTVRYLGYSASSVSFTFTGKQAQATFLSDPEHFIPEEHAFAAIYINDEKTPAKRVELTKKEETILLYENDTEKTVTITIMKYSEPEYAVCGIASITIDSDILLPPPAARSRKIQIVGDSITCGYGVEGSVEEELHRTCTENPTKSYSMLSAQALDADVEIVAWNGKGIISAYIGDDTDTADASWLVPMLYDYADAGCEKQYFRTPADQWERWDDSRFEPDLVMVHLGTNDASYTREIPERNEQFCTAYVALLEKIYRKHPQAKFLCMLGLMDQRLCSTVEEAASRFQKAHPETLCEYLPLPAQLDEDGLGTFWHPSPITHEKAAKLVVAKAREMMGWQE